MDDRQPGPEHPGTAASLNALALLLWHQGDYATARQYYQRALAIREQALGPDHPDTAISLNNLAGLLADQGDSATARKYYERALAICEQVLGPEHPYTADSLYNLAGLLREQGNSAVARQYYKRALAIYKHHQRQQEAQLCHSALLDLRTPKWVILAGGEGGLLLGLSLAPVTPVPLALLGAGLGWLSSSSVLAYRLTWALFLAGSVVTFVPDNLPVEARMAMARLAALGGAAGSTRMGAWTARLRSTWRQWRYRDRCRGIISTATIETRIPP